MKETYKVIWNKVNKLYKLKPIKNIDIGAFLGWFCFSVDYYVVILSN